MFKNEFRHFEIAETCLNFHFAVHFQNFNIRMNAIRLEHSQGQMGTQIMRECFTAQNKEVVTIPEDLLSVHLLYLIN